MQFFYVEECPCASECSAAAWKRANVWGWSEDECKACLVRHLQTSGNHLIPEADALQYADCVELKSDIYTPAPESKQKRRRGGGQDSSGSGGVSSNDEQKQLIQQTIQELMGSDGSDTC